SWSLTGSCPTIQDALQMMDVKLCLHTTSISISPSESVRCEEAPAPDSLPPLFAIRNKRDKFSKLDASQFHSREKGSRTGQMAVRNAAPTIGQCNY
ncbi:hypothetical protein QBC41DRAFT_234286, partial [Cercophora samala]